MLGDSYIYVTADRSPSVYCIEDEGVFHEQFCFYLCMTEFNSSIVLIIHKDDTLFCIYGVLLLYLNVALF